MSKAVVRMAKMKANDLMGIQIHNQRERKSKTNVDIEESQSHLNYDLVNPDKINYKKRVQDIIEGQKISERKIRKDAVLVNELIVTSEKAFFDALSPDQQKAFFSHAVTFFKDRYGEQNIAYAMVHHDEKTPHMHVGVVPMREGKLQGKNVFNRKELLWLQEEFPKQMQQHGFALERGELGSEAEHVSANRLKALQAEQRAFQALDEVQKLEKEKKALQADVNELIKAMDVSKSIDDIKFEKGGVFSPGSVRMASEDFEHIKLLAKSSEALKTNVKVLKSEMASVRKQNQLLQMENKQLIKEKQELVHTTLKLQRENKELTEENRTLKSLQRYYQKLLEETKRLSKRYLYVDLEKIQEYLGKIRMHTAKKVFGEEAMNEKILDTLVPKDERLGGEMYLAFHREKKLEQELDDTENQVEEIEKEKEKNKIKNFEMER